MKAIKKILFPTDFSEIAGNALSVAGEIASKYGAELDLVSVVDPQIYAYAGYVSMLAPEDLLDGPRKAMDELQLPASCEGLTVQRDVIEGYIDEAVADYAKQNQSDLIVMSSHSRGMVARFFLGSVADRVMRSAPCPVLLLRGPDESKADAKHSLKEIKTILAPCDFSHASEQAFARACSLAKVYGANVHLVHALDIGSLKLIGVHFDELALEEASQRAQEHLGRIAAKAKSEGVELTLAVLQGDPSEALIDYAKRVQAQLCVMGNLRRGELGKIFLGSTTDSLARATHLPIWIEPVSEKTE